MSLKDWGVMPEVLATAAASVSVSAAEGPSMLMFRLKMVAGDLVVIVAIGRKREKLMKRCMKVGIR